MPNEPTLEQKIFEAEARQNTRERLVLLKNQRAKEKTVGEPEELIPFAWRCPLKNPGVKKVSKVLKTLMVAEQEKEEIL